MVFHSFPLPPSRPCLQLMPGVAAGVSASGGGGGRAMGGGHSGLGFLRHHQGSSVLSTIPPPRVHADRGIQSFSVDAKREHLYQFWRQHLGGRPALLVGPSLGGAAAIDLAVNHPDVPAGLLLLDAQAFQEGVGPLAALPKFLAYAGVALLKSVQLRMSAIKMAFHDKTLSTEDAMNRFKAELPDCRDVVHLQGCGHIPHVERPADVAQLILEFCSQLQGERERDGAEEEKVAVA
ncbi:unnamed protein product [Closterium sp. NIES-54]